MHTARPNVVNLRRVDQNALAGFDQLPESANVRLPVVAALCGVSPVTVWRWSKSGRLPMGTFAARVIANARPGALLVCANAR